MGSLPARSRRRGEAEEVARRPGSGSGVGWCVVRLDLGKAAEQRGRRERGEEEERGSVGGRGVISRGAAG